MKQIVRHKTISLLLAAAIFAVAGFIVFKYPGYSKAQDENAKWKSFSEDTYGLSIEYPAAWSLDAGYDHYSKGLMNVDLNNKKCGFNPKTCNSECADIRILVGQKPEGERAQGLFAQLYEDFMMVRDFSNNPIVATLELGSKKVFKVANDSATLALNGVCPGPLYVFETDSGYFVYVFAGIGQSAANIGETVEKIISSVKIN